MAKKEPQFPVEQEYTRCVTALTRAGILVHLLEADSMGVTGTEGKEYPLPTLAQVTDLFDLNRELVKRKIPQGFDHLELIPMAMPVPRLIELLASAILRHGVEGKLFQTRSSPADPCVPVRVNNEKHVWIWETLRQALDTDELVYFPERIFRQSPWPDQIGNDPKQAHLCSSRLVGGAG
jgi:hypothetical protein